MFGIRGLLIQEQMRGWIHWHDAAQPEPLAMDLRSYSDTLLRFGGERRIAGELHLDGHPALALSGSLRLALRGPHYRLHVDLPGRGGIDLIGHKTYRLRGLRDSLVTCPLRVYQGERLLATAQIRYEQPLYQFPLQSLRLLRET